MKKHFKILIAMVLATLLFNCSSEDKTIDTVFDNVRSGIILRTLEITSGEYDNDQPTTANFAAIVEIQDTQNGNYADKILVYASYADNNATGNDRTEQLIKTIPSSSFTAGERGYPVSEITVTLNEIKTKLNLNDSQVKTCDVATIRLEVVAKDGLVFTNENASATVTGGSYFNSPFLYSANIVGGVLTESLAGNHTYQTRNMFIPGVPSCGGTVTGTIVWTETGTPGLYATNDMSFGLFESSCWSDNPAFSSSSQVKWFCKTLTSLGTDQYGTTWTYTIKRVEGPLLEIEFISAFDTGEGGIVKITREGGVDWPAIMQD